MAMVAAPMVAALLCIGWRGVDPDCRRAALEAGADEWTIFRRLTLPVLRPYLAFGALLSGLLSLGDFYLGNALSGEAVLLPGAIFSGVAQNVSPLYHALVALMVLVDLLFAGKQTIDGDTAQVGPGIAKRLGLNLLTYVSRIVEVDLDARRLKVERRAEGGVQLLDTTLPSLITMLEGTNEMRFASLDDMLRAGRFPVRRWNKDDAGIAEVTPHPRRCRATVRSGCRPSGCGRGRARLA